MNTSIVKSLLRPNGSKPAGRKVWSIDLETVLLPFFTATNTDGLTLIPQDALGAPLRLAYEKDGSVKFSNSGKPVIRVAKDLADQVRLMRENFTAGLQQYAETVQEKQGEAYKEQVRLNIEAGQPIRERDRVAMDEAVALAVLEAMAQAEASKVAEAVPEAQAEPVPVA